MRILLIEDDEPIREVITRGLEEDRDYSVDTAADGLSGLKLAMDEEYAAIILDIMLPGMDGWRICEELRLQQRRTPILMLTARDSVQDRIRGLELGADDYLPKPFDFDELLARVRALIRRDILKSRMLRIGYLEINTGTRQVRSAGKEVFLTPREYLLLEALALNEGRVMSRDTIQYLDIHIGILRKKIETDQPVKLFHTEQGQGYSLRAPRPEEVNG